MQTLKQAPKRFGLVAHRRHRQADGGLARWVDACEPGIRALDLGLHALGGTYDALARTGRLSSYAPLVRYPFGYEGELMRLVSHVAGGADPKDALDGVIYLIDPVDPSSIYPEAQALKRQCVTHGKPFVATVAGAIEWVAVELAHAGLGALKLERAERLFAVETQTVALIAHDAFKDRMVDFAATHFDLLSRFAGRVGRPERPAAGSTRWRGRAAGPKTRAGCGAT